MEDGIGPMPKVAERKTRPSREKRDHIMFAIKGEVFKARATGSLSDKADQWLEEQFPKSVHGNGKFHTAENKDLVIRWLRETARSPVPTADYLRSRSIRSGQKKSKK